MAYRPPRRPQLVAHRGYSGSHPENTVAAARAAAASGADMIEIDVRVTIDGHPVALHGSRLDHNTDLSGRIERTTLDALRRARIVFDGGVVDGEGVPLLGEILGAAPDLAYNFDLKTDAAIDPVLDLVDAENLHDRCVLSGSPARRVRRVFRRECDVGVLVDLSRLDKLVARIRWLRSRWLVWRHARLLADPRVLAINVDRRWVDAELVDAFTRIGAPVWTFTVDDQAEADRLVALGVESITTNHPGTIRVP